MGGVGWWGWEVGAEGLYGTFWGTLSEWGIGRGRGGKCALKEAKGGVKGGTKEPLPLSFSLPLIVMYKKRGRSQEHVCLFSSPTSNKVLFFLFFFLVFCQQKKPRVELRLWTKRGEKKSFFFLHFESVLKCEGVDKGPVQCFIYLLFSCFFVAICSQVVVVVVVVGGVGW